MRIIAEKLPLGIIEALHGVLTIAFRLVCRGGQNHNHLTLFPHGEGWDVSLDLPGLSGQDDELRHMSVGGR